MPNNDVERSYGQGAQGEIAPEQRAAKISFWTKLRYNFDNSIAKPSSFVLYLFVSLVVLSVLVVFLRTLLLLAPALATLADGTLQAPPELTFNTFWNSFATLAGRGGEATWAERIIGLVVWAISITIT